ncbi:MAG: hypothetical protein ACI4FZ_08735 [Lachnospiraceae bacterium]
MADGSLIFDTKVDTSEFQKGTQDIKNDVKKVSEAMKNAGKEIEATINGDIAESIDGIGAQAQETSAKIQAILDNTEKSAKSKAASIGAIYKAQGMNASDAMRMAWTHIERGSADVNECIRSDAEKTSKQVEKKTKKSAEKIEKQFKQSGNNVVGIFKKVGAAIASAFAVRQIVSFGKEAIGLASDLQEVQNVVDTAFGDMAYKMEAFADTCIEMYGMSKLTAKEMGSTFMAMAKGMGQATDVASDKAVELTGRLGDIMSFYNKTASEVNTIGKAIYSGETEPLKQIGIVMTETNLEAYALAKGYGKLYSKMSSAEKLLVRQEYFLEQTQMAAGDFVKTQDSWANQTRILSERWKEFMTICGNGLMQVLTPVVRTLNQMVSSLIDVGNELSAIFGINVSSNISEEAAKAQEELAAMGDSIEEAEKQAEGSTASFDDLVIIGGAESDTGAVENASAIETRKEETDATEESEKATSKLEQALISVGETLGWLGGVFETSFVATFGNKSVFDSIMESFRNLRDSMMDTFSTEGMKEAASGFLEAYVEYLGSGVGAFASVGASLADNLAGGAKLSFDENKESVQNSMLALFDVGEQMAGVLSDFNGAASGIFEVFRSDDAKQLTADIISLFSSAFFGVTELTGQFGVDILELLTAPFTENEELIQTTIEDTFSSISPFLWTLKDIVDEVFGTIRSVYDEKIYPMIVSLRDGFTNIGTTLLEVYNEYILPVVDYASMKFDEFASGPLSDLIEKFGEFAGKVADCVRTIWNEFLEPFILWFIENIAPEISAGLTSCIDMFFLLWSGISEVAGYILDALGGILDFITSVFTGDWEGAWNGIKEFFFGICNAMKTRLDTWCEAIKKLIKPMLDDIKKTWEARWGAIKEFFSGICNAMKTRLDTWCEAIKMLIKPMLNDIKKTWEARWSAIKEFFSGIWTNLKNLANNSMLKMKLGISNSLNTIKDKFTKIFTDIKSTVARIFGELWDKIKEIINRILGGVESMANGVVKAINKVIDALNGLSFEVPDWVPKYGGEYFGFNIPKLSEVSIPKLATGTVVPANYGEFAAILGDNKREAEVVSPVSTMKQAFKETIAELGGLDGGDYTFIAELDGEVIFREMIRQNRRYKKQTGKPAFQ